MSLAMYAAPFNNNDYMDKVNDTDTPIGRKKNANNKTQKRYYTAPPKDNNNTDKINNILRTIHNLPERNDEELADFNELLPPPISAGVEQTKAKEGFGTANQLSAFVSPVNPPEMDENIKSIYSNLNAHTNDMSFASATDYGRFIPDYSKMYGTNGQKPQQQAVGFTSTGTKSQNDVLMEKLNYMITLLEQQESDKTNNVTEEVILYSFLGIFIIFIVDSFARVGKYVR
uniref:Uncharacterized protein n=1 Tax=viral metagenome TaxID=1070528 RepID=A0A6C0CWA6_9ZZZZ